MTNVIKRNYEKCDTLGKIAKLYKYSRIDVLMGNINGYESLKIKIENITNPFRNKGQKKLPHSIIDEIFELLGEP